MERNGSEDAKPSGFVVGCFFSFEFEDGLCNEADCPLDFKRYVSCKVDICGADNEVRLQILCIYLSKNKITKKIVYHRLDRPHHLIINES